MVERTKPRGKVDQSLARHSCTKPRGSGVARRCCVKDVCEPHLPISKGKHTEQILCCACVVVVLHVSLMADHFVPHFGHGCGVREVEAGATFRKPAVALIQAQTIWKVIHWWRRKVRQKFDYTKKKITQGATWPADETFITSRFETGTTSRELTGQLYPYKLLCAMSPLRSYKSG